MRKEYYFIAALVLFAVFLFGVGSRAGFALQAVFRGAPSSAFSLTASADDILRGKGEVASHGGGVTVQVYSQYPLNVKNQLSIAAGSADGIKTGDVALAKGYFVGIVEKAFEHSAVVQTVFDRRFQAPVRIGEGNIDALLRGGSEPTLTLISVSAPVHETDAVYTAASGTPYGTPIGSLRYLRDADDKVFKEGVLAAPYDPGSLEELTILPAAGQ